MKLKEKVRFDTTIEKGGKLWPPHGQELNKILKANIGEALIITIEPRKETRSSKQNRYYWGVVIKTIVNAFAEQDIVYGKDELHECFIQHFAQLNEIEDPISGGVLLMKDRTSKMDKPDFIDYVDKIIAWAAGKGIIVPAPNRYL